MDEFKEIRPYQDHEIRPVLDSLLNDREFVLSIAGFYYPRLTKLATPLVYFLAKNRIKSQLVGVHNVATMQDVIAIYMDKMISDTTTEFTHSGLSELDPSRHYLFMSNHRDITMDPALVNYKLYHAKMDTLQIAIGDNLLKKPFVTDLMRLNKSFIVKRSLKGRELLKALDLLSRYIHHCIESQNNVWIAQREGRAKDGIDKTESALIKMLARGRKSLPLGESINELHLVPVAISYEYDACDKLKAEELYETEVTGSFQKTDESDIQSIVTGMMGHKGRVHISFGSEVSSETDDPEELALQIDKQIINSYRLFDSNYIALEMLQSLPENDVPPLSDEVENYAISKTSRKEFESRLAGIDTRLHDYVLKIYANPVISKFKLPQIN